ncbi:NADH-ubiquinone oxidoreductase B18 subunit-domain-containing protein [Xylogone sp. PMI_703]|nr:NADH-ubiquinone oxidoreductase B18 subunit-domain-containing protein [Xylogone sp. PMI_703]
MQLPKAPSTSIEPLGIATVEHQSPTMTVVEAVKEAVGLGSSSTPATRQQMSDAKLPLAYRDSCANLLIPLNRCRYEEFYLPWKCETERHSYEKCQEEQEATRPGQRTMYKRITKIERALLHSPMLLCDILPRFPEISTIMARLLLQ